MTKVRTPLISTLALALVAAACLLGVSGGNDAAAADAETAALISKFNAYRNSQGVAPLATSSSLNQQTQAAANESVQACAFKLPSGSGKKWGAYAYPTAQMLWDAYLQDPITLPWIRDPKYKSVGVGRAISSSCHYGHMWIIWLSTEGGGESTTPPPTPTPTPTATQQPTATPQPTPSDPNQTPTASPIATVAPTPTAAPSNTPGPTPFLQVQGDVNCDGAVSLLDAIEVMKYIGDADANVACTGPTGVDCVGGIDENDALALMRFLGGIPFEYPDGCPHIGSPAATPTPQPTASPPDNETPAPTATHTPTPTPVAGGSDQCWLAIIAYDMTYGWELNGDHNCETADGAAYTCSFPEASNQATCSTDAGDLSTYACHVYPNLAVPCLALYGPDAADYVCERTTPIVCTSDGAPAYECDVAAQVATCTGPATIVWPQPDL